MNTKLSLQATIAAALLSTIAGSAQAGPTLSLIWESTGTPTISTVTAGAGPEVLNIVLTADATAVTAVFVSFSFDSDLLNELNYFQGGELPFVFIGPGNSFTPVVHGISLLDESSAGIEGIIHLFDQFTLSTGLVNGTRTLGSMTFSLNAGIDDGVDILPVILPNGIDDIFGAGGSDITGITTFVGASVIPEPSTGLLLTAGGCLIGWAGRRRKQR